VTVPCSVNLLALLARFKGGFVTRECSLAEVGIDKVKAVSDAWCNSRNMHHGEPAFLSRPLVLAEEPDVRRFFAFDRDGKLVAFAVFDPVYEGGEVVGYTSQHNRHLPEADAMVHFAITRSAIETFQKEGLKVLHLGLSPFADVLKDQEFKANKNWMTSQYFAYAYKNWLFNRYVYPNQALEAYKRVYRGVQAQTYYAFNSLPSLPRLLKVMRACNVM
jgi:lysylphosphatidylglycerol synthetase-like protein (DUF2156 family)